MRVRISNTYKGPKNLVGAESSIVEIRGNMVKLDDNIIQGMIPIEHAKLLWNPQFLEEVK